MPTAICFKTMKFDVSKEDKNPINPIYGQSLLLWLKGVVPQKLQMSDPDVEDWGWYSFVDWEGRTYLIGASSDDGEHWFLQADNQRTFLEAITGRCKMKTDDPCMAYFYELLSTETEFRDLEFS